MKGIVDNSSKAHVFSHFMPYSDTLQPLLFEADKGIKIPLLPIADTVLLPNILDSYS